MNRSEITLQYELVMPQVLLINSPYVLLHISSFFCFSYIEQLIDLFMIKRKKRIIITDRLDIISTRLLLNNISVWRILIIICNPCIVLSLLSLSLLYCCSVFWPRSKVLPAIVFFFLFFLLAIVVQSVVTASCPFGWVQWWKGKKNLPSLSNVKWLSPSLSFEQEEHWVALFQDNFIQSIGQCCIYFLCTLYRCKKKKNDTAWIID
jgi:hypothetical protein